MLTQMCLLWCRVVPSLPLPATLMRLSVFLAPVVLIYELARIIFKPNDTFNF